MEDPRIDRRTAGVSAGTLMAQREGHVTVRAG